MCIIEDKIQLISINWQLLLLAQFSDIVGYFKVKFISISVKIAHICKILNSLQMFIHITLTLGSTLGEVGTIIAALRWGSGDLVHRICPELHNQQTV